MPKKTPLKLYAIFSMLRMLGGISFDYESELWTVVDARLRENADGKAYCELRIRSGSRLLSIDVYKKKHIPKSLMELIDNADT